MSKRRLVILSVVVEGRSQAVVAREFSVSEATVSRWVARYRAEGDAALEVGSGWADEDVSVTLRSACVISFHLGAGASEWPHPEPADDVRPRLV